MTPPDPFTVQLEHIAAGFLSSVFAGALWAAFRGLLAKGFGS